MLFLQQRGKRGKAAAAILLLFGAVLYGGDLDKPDPPDPPQPPREWRVRLIWHPELERLVPALTPIMDVIP